MAKMIDFRYLPICGSYSPNYDPQNNLPLTDDPQISTAQKARNLKCQFGTSSSKSTEIELDTELKSTSVTSRHGGRRTPPYAFTEQGVAMLSSVLNSDRAIEVNIAIMRTFVQLRELMADNQMLQDKIERLEKKYDGQFAQVFDAIKRLMKERDDD